MWLSKGKKYTWKVRRSCISKKVLSDKEIDQLDDLADEVTVIPYWELSDEERKLNDQITNEFILTQKKQSKTDHNKKG